MKEECEIFKNYLINRMNGADSHDLKQKNQLMLKNVRDINEFNWIINLT